MPGRRLFVCAFLVMILMHSASGQGAWSADSLITKQQMQDDLDSLRQVILDSHPNPFVFYSSSEFENHIAELKNNVDSVSTLREFTSVLSSVLLPLRDSHTTLDFFSLHHMCFANDSYFLPLNIYSSDDTIFIESDWEDFLPRGARLLSINKVNAADIYRQAMDYSCIEGDANTGQKRIADAIFPIVYAWNNAVQEENEIEVIPHGNESPETFSLKAYRKKEYQRLSKLRSAHESHKAVSFKFLEGDTIAVLRVATFAPANGNKYRRDIHNSFRKMKKAGCNNLVLDIRDNSGGSSAWVEYLYSFLDSAGYNTPSNVIGKNSKIAMQRSKMFNNGISKLIINIFYRKDEDVQSFNRFTSLPLGAMDTSYFKKPTLQKASRVYNRNCVLLINGLTASAGVDFTNHFKRMNRGLIIGEPCLGPVSGTFGNPASYRLPNSRLRINIATIRYNYDNSFTYAREAIAPDVQIKTTGMDLFLKEDPALKFIISNSSFSR